MFLRTGVKQDTVTALRTAPLHTHSLFSDQLLLKAEEEVSRSEERRSAGNSHRKPSHYHPYASTDKPSHQPDQKSGVPAWKQIRDWQQSRKGCGKAKNRLRVQSSVNDSYCVKCVTALKDCACVSCKLESLNPSPVIAGKKDLTSKRETVNLHVNSSVVNPVLIVKGYSQKKGVNSSYCHHSQRLKCVKDVSCVHHLSSGNLVTNVPTVAPDLPVRARLLQFWEQWAALGASPKVVI